MKNILPKGFLFVLLLLALCGAAFGGPPPGEPARYYVAESTLTVTGWKFPGDTIFVDTSGGAGGWTDDGNHVRLTTVNDSVGIGTATPDAKLEVVGEIKTDTLIITEDITVPNNSISPAELDEGAAFTWTGTNTWTECAFFDDNSGDSPDLDFVDESNHFFRLKKYNAGFSALWNNEGEIRFVFSNDDDYIYFDTFSADVPMISTRSITGDCDLVVNASSGHVSFDTAALIVDGDTIKDFTGTNLTVTAGVLNAAGGGFNWQDSAGEPPFWVDSAKHADSALNADSLGHVAASSYLTSESDPVWTSDSADYAMKTWIGPFIDTTTLDTIANAHDAVAADSAGKALQDASGNVITTTYATPSMFGPFIDTTTLDTIQNAHKAVLSDDADTSGTKLSAALANRLDDLLSDVYKYFDRTYFDTAADAGGDSIICIYSDSTDLSKFDTDDLSEGTAKYNVTHTGDVTGATELTIAANIVDTSDMAHAPLGKLIRDTITDEGYITDSKFSDSSIILLNATAWRLFYSNATTTAIQELALGADGTYLKSNGVSLAPTWATPGGAGWNWTDSTGFLVGWGGVAKSVVNDSNYFRFEGSADFDTTGGSVSLADDAVDPVVLKDSNVQAQGDIVTIAASSEFGFKTAGELALMEDEDINTFAELQAWVSDKTLLNDADAATITALWVFTQILRVDNDLHVEGNIYVNKDSTTADAVLYFQDDDEIVTFHWDDANNQFEISDGLDIITGNLDISSGNITLTGTVDGIDVSEFHSDYATDSTKLDGIEAGATADQTAGEIEAIVSHDNLLDFVANEHIDWTADQGATNIHSGNYTDLTGLLDTIATKDTVVLVGAAAADTTLRIYRTTGGVDSTTMTPETGVLILGLEGTTRIDSLTVDLIKDADNVTMDTLEVTTSLKIPNSDNPTVDDSGKIAWENDDGCFRVKIGDSTAAIGAKKFFSATLALPKNLYDSLAVWTILPVQGSFAPHGIYLESLWIKTDNSSSYSVIFEEWSAPQSETNDIDTIATSTGYEAGGVPSDRLIIAGGMIKVRLPATAGTKELIVMGSYWIRTGD